MHGSQLSGCMLKPMICPWNKGEENKEVPSKNAEAPPSSAKRSSPVAKHIADQFEVEASIKQFLFSFRDCNNWLH